VANAIGQLELFSLDSISTLPRLSSDLKSLFQYLNHKYWNSSLPHCRCEWSNRMITTWGCYYPDRKLIRISSFFKDRPLPELLALLCHEMIHIKYRGHGIKFKRELKRIGLEGDMEASFPHLTELTQNRRRSLRYLYECPLCKQRLRRRKIIHGYCARCYQSSRWSKLKLIRA
jgi:predicted SprT family Zn-dependent metalloprotease